MTKEEILASADFAMEQGMGTLMLQSGELPTPARVDFMVDVIRAIRQRTVEVDVRRRYGRDCITEDDLEKGRQLGTKADGDGAAAVVADLVFIGHHQPPTKLKA